MDVTERVRANVPPMPGETALVKIGRSRTPLIILVATGALAAAITALIVFGGDDTATSRPVAVDPSTEPLAEPDPPDPSAAKAQDPAKTATAPVEDPAKTDPKAIEKDPDPVKAAQDPRTAKKPPRNGRPPRVAKQPRAGTPSKKDPARNPLPRRSRRMDPDSPFMPVRTPDKK